MAFRASEHLCQQQHPWHDLRHGRADSGPGCKRKGRAVEGTDGAGLEDLAMAAYGRPQSRVT